MFLAMASELLFINGGLLIIAKFVLFCLICSPGLNQRGKVKINGFSPIFKKKII